MTTEELLIKDPSQWLINLIQDVMGYERGFNQNADVVTQTRDGQDLNAIWREFQATLALWNSERDNLLNMLTFDVSNPIEDVIVPTGDIDFEEASEFGEPKGVRIGKPQQMGYSFKWWDLAARYTWMFLAEANQAQVEAVNASVLEAGNRLYFTKAMQRIFNNGGETANINNQNYNVYPLYNGDGTVPPPYHGTTFNSNHTHYLTSGATTVDYGDLTDLETHLYHHGYRLTLGYQLVLMANRAQSATIRTFKVANGAPYDFIPGQGIGGGVILPTGTVVGAPSGNIRGQIGTYGPFIVVEEDYIPAGYLLAFASGGPQNLGNLVGIRQHANPALRGLQLVKGRDNDYPLVDSFYRFGFGTGIRHRGAGVVMQVTTDATYSPPSIYA